ncbi:hypothetical protein [Shumkonia mesophila]|uniref:hypothetical protein n=1 Tax=Shumkonia mesophila TaxID=2838854 RepID=UPI00293412B4|nr:hypothetical protein [Shumkonia mesophila]
MLGMLAILVATATFLSVEGSLVYYRLPSTPLWLRQRKGLQVLLSSSLANGFTIALFMLGQYFVSLQGKPFPLFDLVPIGAVVVAYWLARRQLRAFERRALGSAETVATVADGEVAQRAA